MNRRMALVAICILGLVTLSLGCDTPSEADIEQAVLNQIARSEPFLGFEPPYKWVQEVRVVDIGKSYTINTVVGDYTYWPVKVRLIGDGREEETRVELYRDEFGEWISIGPY